MKISNQSSKGIFKGIKTAARPSRGLASIVLASLCMGVLASQTVMAQSEAPPPPPIREPLPPKVTAPEDPLDQEVVIRQEEGRMVEEYRRSGLVYMVRIVPTIGEPYYLIDTTGDGLLDMKHDTFEPIKPVYWKIFDW